MNITYKLLSKAIELYARARDRISPGWYKKNSARVREWMFMAYAFSRSKTGIVGGAIVTVYIVLAVIGPIIVWEPYWIYKSVDNPKLWLHPPCLPPCSEAPLLGTDEWGRDIVAMSLYGMRISLVVSIIVVFIGAAIGIILGLIAGYKGGIVDEVIMRITDIFMAFPGLVLAIAFAAVLPQRIRGFLEVNDFAKNFLAIIFGLRPQEYAQIAALISMWLAMIIVWWPGYVRIVRGSVLSVREQPFIEAAKVLGVSTWRIIVKHILPNVISPILVMMTFDLATATLFAAALSFLGLGPKDPIPDLGFLVSKAGAYFPERSWHIVLYLGTLLLVIALGWNLLGDTLRDVFDPRTRRALEFRGEESG